VAGVHQDLCQYRKWLPLIIRTFIQINVHVLIYCKGGGRISDYQSDGVGAARADCAGQGVARVGSGVSSGGGSDGGGRKVSFSLIVQQLLKGKYLSEEQQRAVESLVSQVGLEFCQNPPTAPLAALWGINSFYWYMFCHPSLFILCSGYQNAGEQSSVQPRLVQETFIPNCPQGRHDSNLPTRSGSYLPSD
jgi:hypothetical protein